MDTLHRKQTFEWSEATQEHLWVLNVRIWIRMKQNLQESLTAHIKGLDAKKYFNTIYIKKLPEVKYFRKMYNRFQQKISDGCLLYPVFIWRKSVWKKLNLMKFLLELILVKLNRVTHDFLCGTIFVASVSLTSTLFFYFHRLSNMRNLPETSNSCLIWSYRQ